jgi:hypothetical protein
MTDIQTSEVDEHFATRGHEILNADRSSKAEELTIRPFL